MKSMLTLSILMLLVGCANFPPKEQQKSTLDITVTSAAGAKQQQVRNTRFQTGQASGVVVHIHPDQPKQTIEGIGSSFTEASAFVLATLSDSARKAVMNNIYSAEGANFSLTRTHIGACDFTVDGKYSYLDTPGDTTLNSFSLAPDLAGFSKQRFPQIQNESYDLLPMIKEALAIKSLQADKTLKIVSSAWTGPPWMKDNGTFYEPSSPANNYQGTGGVLLPEYYDTYARYLLRYLDEYAKQGVPVWGLTPVNEPHGVNGSWESMHFTPATQSAFVQQHLGPALRNQGHAEKRLLIYDQNRDGLEEWAHTLFPADADNRYIHGAAVHWYASTVNVFEDVFEKIHEQFPEYTLMHTEGCIDDLGKEGPPECTDQDGRKEENWFMNDDFWWSKSATDWGYAVPWSPGNGADHPMYVPVHRYARNIIVSLDHWLSGWIDWNVVLDAEGGPNHVGNNCGAPIMIDTHTKAVYYTPIYHVLAQFSRSIRPGDVALTTHTDLANLETDRLHACATMNAEGVISVQLLNTGADPLEYGIQVGAEYSTLSIPANAVQTVRFKP